MRINPIVLIFSVLFAISACASKNQISSIEKINSKWIKSPLHLEFEPQSAQPFNGGLVHLSGGYYSLEIKSDTVNFRLPFYGRAYQIDMNDVGYTIEGAILSNLTVSENSKKESIMLQFEAKKEGNTYTFQLEYWENGKAYLDLRSMQRDHMSYDGYLKAVETE